MTCRGLLMVCGLTGLLMGGCSGEPGAPARTSPGAGAVKPAPASAPAPLATEGTSGQESNVAKQEQASGAGTGGRAEAVFAGGCFWCVEAVFEELEGVIEAESGYAGGDAATANYKAVSTGRTTHAEVVRIVYDPSVITYHDLLKVHFATHDPTTLNRQGADVGPQYRSAIFYANESEKSEAEGFIRELTSSGVFGRPIVTTLEPLTAFYPAEAYHQNYVCDNPMNPYVRNVSWPKVKKVREKFGDRLKDKSPLER